MIYIKLFEQFVEYENEQGGNVVYDDGNYIILVSTMKNPSRMSLWCDGKNVGNLYMGNNQKIDDETYSFIDSIEIDKKHRGNKLGKKLYQVALKYWDNDGIVSYLPNRYNKNTVPSIYKSLGAFEKGDYSIIPKNNVEKENISFKDFTTVANEYDVKPMLIRLLMDELKYEYKVKRVPLNKLSGYLKNEIEWAIEYDSRKPRDYGYGTNKKFKIDLEKIKNLTINDLIVL